MSSLKGHKWHSNKSSQIRKGLLFHCQKSDINEIWLQFILCAVTSFVSRDGQKIVPRVVCGNEEACCFFLLVCRLEHQMGFLLREVEIREKPTVQTVPCLGLISVSICIRHCSGDRVRIRFLTPGGGHLFLPCFFEESVNLLRYCKNKWFR